MALQNFKPYIVDIEQDNFSKKDVKNIYFFFQNYIKL